MESLEVLQMQLLWVEGVDGERESLDSVSSKDFILKNQLFSIK